MLRTTLTCTLGLALASAPAFAQMVGRSSPPPQSSVARPSALPPVRMNSVLPRPIDTRFPLDSRRGRTFSRGYWLDACLDPWTWCRALNAVPYVAETVVQYPVPVPVYVPVPYATRPTEPAPPRKPYDPAKSRMLTIGGGADGGGGVMRIEPVSDSLVRLTWLGNPRPIREARLFLADSAQHQLRSARVDSVTPSVLFDLTPWRADVAYAGLTIHFADGATQTTLVPFPAGRSDPPAR
jgi:hypothetical protein